MPSFKMKDKSVVEFKPFCVNRKRLVKLILIASDGEYEGIWVALSIADYKDYKADVIDISYQRVCISQNATLAGVPWGAYIPFKLQGSDRPILNMKDMVRNQKVILAG